MTTPQHDEERAGGKLPRIAARKFTNANSGANNHLFLYTYCSEPPFMKAIEGWKIVGYGKAPWPKDDSHFAVMFEKQVPAGGYPSHRGEECEEGTQIWMHYKEQYVGMGKVKL